MFHQINDISNTAIGFEISILCVDLHHWSLMQIELKICVIKNDYCTLPKSNYKSDMLFNHLLNISQFMNDYKYFIYCKNHLVKDMIKFRKLIFWSNNCNHFSKLLFRWKASDTKQKNGCNYGTVSKHKLCQEIIINWPIILLSLVLALLLQPLVVFSTF